MPVAVIPRHCQGFDVTVNAEAITAVTGTNQTFRCNYNLSQIASDMKVRWYKFASSLPELWHTYYTPAESGSFSFVGPGFDMKVKGDDASPALLDSHSIMLLNIQQEDAGSYFCFVVYLNDTSFITGTSPNITLTVQSELIVKHEA